MIIRRLNGLILGFIVLCTAQQDKEVVKNVIVQEILQKMFNITSTALEKAPPSLKDNILKKIENKLKLSAQRFGTKRDKYVQLVMDGLTILANNNSQVQAIRKQSEGLIKVPTTAYNNLRIEERDIVHTSSRQPNDFVVNQIADNILKIAKKYKNKGKTANEKRFIIQSIRNKVLESAKKEHHRNHTNHDEIKAYTDLITRGMELMIKELAQNKRRMGIFTEDNNVTVPIHNKSDVEATGQIALSAINNGFFDVSTPDTLVYGVTTSIPCDAIVNQTCTDLKSLNQYVCSGSGKILSLNKLCNGVKDCSNGCDEEKCLDKAMTRMQRAIRMMSRVETYFLRDCFISNDNPLLVKQNAVLNDVLRKQLGYLQKYANIYPNVQPEDTISIKKALNEVVLVINALAVAIGGSLCSQQFRNTSNIESIVQKQVSLLDNDLFISIRSQSKVSLKSCSCVESFCADISCPEACKSVCWHSYNLGRWGCQAVDETTSVPLDMLCDGKLDCYDETDEIPCNTGATINKFEANEMYDVVLNIIKIKSVSKEYSHVQNKLSLMYNTVSELQKETSKPNADVLIIKSVRDKCFSYLVSIYNDLVNKAAAIDELSDPQLLLLTLNEKLGNALKLSHTGNNKIIPRTGCICRESRCLSPQCSKICERACSVKPKFTKYWCKGFDSNNFSIGIERICNKKPDCPYEDDEAQCITDVCRKHHLMVLRQSLQDVGEKQKGTSVGEILISWKERTTATLKKVESNYRPTPTTHRDIVNDILNDLVMAYASIEQNVKIRRNHEYTFKEFLEISQRVTQSLRSCGR